MDFLIAIFPTGVGHTVAVRAGGSGGVFHGYLLRISFQDYVYFLFRMIYGLHRIVKERASHLWPFPRFPKVSIV